ncbi:ADP-ribosylglycohydrolase family protein [Actinomyces sp. S4-C9]|uniref:ADP-ribosylglycohydrolase family protein n=2 Tax=unclassified Actinomyces TaxID=2609248 RepID=UPI00050F76B7|nr:ADP-ribosylglycohydrolase family protein [Actinomyces sp. S4-C9]KGF01793.1 hypothetical protein HMPREF1628_04475 [Actinomyces sp. S4-C9]
MSELDAPTPHRGRLVRVRREHSDVALSAVGAVSAMAVGSALGVPWELATPPTDAQRLDLRGRSGQFDEGEWGADVQLAVLGLEVAAQSPLGSQVALDQLAVRLMAWYRSHPAQVAPGLQAVLQWADQPSLAPAHLRGRIEQEQGESPSVARLVAAASARWESLRPRARVAGNEVFALMVPVGLSAALDSRECTRVSLEVVRMVTPDPRTALLAASYAQLLRGALAGFAPGRPWQECLDWHAAVANVLDGIGSLGSECPIFGVEGVAGEDEAFLLSMMRGNDAGVASGLGAGLDAVSVMDRVLAAVRVAEWEQRGNAQLNPVWMGVSSAVRAGGDTDTVACLAGALLGAAAGVGAVPADLTRQVWGWPGLRQDGLRDLATAAVYAGLAS